MNGIMTGNPSQREVCHRFAAFIAQAGHESLGLLYWEEIASGEAYEGNRVLGNTQPGDGVRYKGRGAIQITGRFNYKTCGEQIGYPLEAQPDLVNFPSLGFRTAVWFWNTRRLNLFATGNETDFVSMTRLINGGTKGLDDRLERWNVAKEALGCI
jgi:putative chitinase